MSKNYKQSQGTKTERYHSNLPLHYKSNSSNKNRTCLRCKYYSDSDVSTVNGYCNLFSAPINNDGSCKKFESYDGRTFRKNTRRHNVKIYSNRYKKNKTAPYKEVFKNQIKKSRKSKIIMEKEINNNVNKKNPIINIYNTNGNKLITSSGESYNHGNGLYDTYQGLFHTHKNGQICAGKTDPPSGMMSSRFLYPKYTYTYPNGRNHHNSKKLIKNIINNPLKLRKRNKKVKKR